MLQLNINNGPLDAKFHLKFNARKYGRHRIINVHADKLYGTTNHMSHIEMIM